MTETPPRTAQTVDIAHPAGEVAAAQREIGVVGPEGVSGPIGAVGTVPFAAFGQHVAELHPDGEIVGMVAQKMAIVVRRRRPAARIAGGVRLFERPPDRPLSPIASRHFRLAIMPGPAAK